MSALERQSFGIYRISTALSTALLVLLIPIRGVLGAAVGAAVPLSPAPLNSAVLFATLAGVHLASVAANLAQGLNADDGTCWRTSAAGSPSGWRRVEP